MSIGYPISGKCIGSQHIASVSSSTALTVPAGATQAIIAPSTQGIRIALDATDPTGTTGFPVAAGDNIWIVGNLANVRIIQQTASATVDVLFF